MATGAALLSWRGSNSFELMKTLFWNRAITRVVGFESGGRYGLPLEDEWLRAEVSSESKGGR